MVVKNGLKNVVAVTNGAREAFIGLLGYDERDTRVPWNPLMCRTFVNGWVFSKINFL